MPVEMEWSITALPPTALEPSAAELLGHFMHVSWEGGLGGVVSWEGGWEGWGEW